MHDSPNPDKQQMDAKFNYQIENSKRMLAEKDELLIFSNAVSLVRDKYGLIELLTNNLKQLISINGFMIFTLSDEQNLLYPYLIHFDEGREPAERYAGEGKFTVSINRDEITTGIINSPAVHTWSLSQLMKMNNRPDYITKYRINNIKKMAAGRLISQNETKGILFIFSDDSEAFGPGQQQIIEGVLPLISNAVMNSLFHENLIREKKEKGILVSLLKSVRSVNSWPGLEHALIKAFGTMNFFDEASLFLFKEGGQRGTPLTLKLAAGPVNARSKTKPAWEFNMDDDFIGLIKNLKHPQLFGLNELLNLPNIPDYVNSWNNNAFKAALVAPVINDKALFGAVILLTTGNSNILLNHLQLVNDMAEQISITCLGILEFEQIAGQLNELNRFKNQLEIENSYLQEEIQTAHNYSEIVGTSNTMKQVFHLVSQVSATNSSVLILGETGTGKELIARAIHNGSSRKEKVMIKVNCATLPANLIESELFGHERGSFTGAMERRIGKFELANNSSIFLDEIGEMPLGLQVKLLRALQEKEIERVGGKIAIKTDVRVIAATNRDLYKEVQAGNFRSDLYFRLNVFPIILPALRDRKEDIPLLALHFVQKYANKLTFSKVQFTSRALKQLIAYNWPGNVRELEHLVERSILVARGKSINEVYLPGTGGDDHTVPLQNKDVKTIDEVEREHIISVLKMVNGKVSGIGGAAEILKIPATTLSSKIRRLKIKKDMAQPG